MTPVFDHAFQERLAELTAWRRDVRRFRTDPLPEGAIERLLALAAISPSVGNSQPWRFVRVRTPAVRQAIVDECARANAEAASTYSGEQGALYRRLKLEGLREAPEHVAVFCNDDCKAGARLGRLTMPETLRYSVVGAVHALWLLARAEGIGLGWVSILDPARVSAALDAPEDWALVGYLCIGYPLEEHEDPELVRHGWQDRLPLDAILFTR